MNRAIALLNCNEASKNYHKINHLAIRENKVEEINVSLILKRLACCNQACYISPFRFEINVFVRKIYSNGKKKFKIRLMSNEFTSLQTFKLYFHVLNFQVVQNL